MVTLGVGLVAALAAAGSVSKATTPTEVAKQFYVFASQDRCKEAEALFTRESVAVINHTLGSAQGFAAFCAERGHAGRSVALTVESQHLAGDRARVRIFRTYGDGSMAVEDDELVRRSGSWKLVVGSNQVTNMQVQE